MVGFDTYHVAFKIVFSGINEKTMLKFLGIIEKKGQIVTIHCSHCTNFSQNCSKIYFATLFQA